jgi:hypothetical protein
MVRLISEAETEDEAVVRQCDKAPQPNQDRSRERELSVRRTRAIGSVRTKAGKQLSASSIQRLARADY